MTDSDVAFRRTDLPIAERARDLLARLSRDERIAMLHQAVPAIERLGNRRFHTGCEALHGVGGGTGVSVCDPLTTTPRKGGPSWDGKSSPEPAGAIGTDPSAVIGDVIAGRTLPAGA